MSESWRSYSDSSLGTVRSCSSKVITPMKTVIDKVENLQLQFDIEKLHKFYYEIYWLVITNT